MRVKRFSIYPFLVALLIFSLVIPANVADATKQEERTTGTLTIHKLALEPSVAPSEGRGDGNKLNPPPDGEAVKGVTYKLKQTHTFDGHHWTEIDGKEFTMTTEEDGKVTKTLDLGRYEVTEISGPDYVNVNTETFKVDIPMTSEDGSKLNYDVHVYPKNELIRGNAKLITYANETEKTLDGVKIKVFHKNGVPVVHEETGEEIILTTKNGKVKIDNLRYGEYYFQEVESIDGYLLNGEKIPFSINKSGELVVKKLQNYSPPDVEKEVDKEAVNRGETVEFTITVNLPLDITRYNKFDVIDQLHENLIYVGGSANEPTGFTFSYDDTTKTLTWSGDPDSLSPGKVTFNFKAKVATDAKANEPIENEAVIDYDNGYVTRTDKSPPTTVTPTAGSLTVKIDSKSKEGLKGAEFEVRDAAGNVVATGTSGEDGVVDFNGATDELDYGDYTIHETKAPEGYRAITKPIEVTINSDNHQAEVKVKNYKSDWELPRTGGIGTLLYSLVGITLMGTAGYMYARRKKGERV